MNILQTAQKENYAVGQFNTSNLEITKAIINAAEKFQLPVIIGTSEGEREFLGIEQIVSLISAYKKEVDTPLILNADHCHSFESFQKAVDAGYDAAHIDASDRPFKKNITLTQKCVQYANKKNPSIIIEGELGAVGGSSSVHREKIKVEKSYLTDPQQAKEFVEKTKIDLLACAIGNVHGVYQEKPELDFDRLQAIAKNTNIPLVLHGASGIPAQDIKKAISLGVAKINVNTELRIAYTKSLKHSLRENPHQTTPYKIMPPVVKAVQEVVESKLNLFTTR